MQARAGVGLDEDLAGDAVARRPVAEVAFHRRDDEDQTRMIAVLFQQAGDHIFLADRRPRNVFDPDPGLGGARRRALPNAISERLSEC